MVLSLFGIGVMAGLLRAADETSAPAPTVDEIVARANVMSYYQGLDGRARVKMTITDKQKRTREREFVVLRQDVTDGGDQKYFVYFDRPADVRAMVFMVHKYTDPKKDDDRWLYLPNLDLVKRVAASDKRTSFVGSDFLYEDVSGRSLLEDKHELKETTGQYFILRNTPIKPETVEFKYFDVFVDRTTYIPMKMEYYDNQDKLYRRIESLQIETIAVGEEKFPTVVKSRVSDLRTESSTEMAFSDVQYNIKLEDIFTERYLRRPPREARR